MRVSWLMELTQRKSSPEPVVERVGNYPPPKTGADETNGRTKGLTDALLSLYERLPGWLVCVR